MFHLLTSTSLACMLWKRLFTQVLSHLSSVVLSLVRLATLPLVFLVYAHSQLMFHIDIYSQFRNPSSTVTQLNATLPLLFYSMSIYTHISSHVSTFTKELFRDQECSSHFLTFHTTFHYISQTPIASTRNSHHHISSHFITFHHIYQFH